MKSAIDKNAETVERELDWFFQVLDTRIKLYFGHDCECVDVSEVRPPLFKSNSSDYARLLEHYNFTFAERVVFMLGLTPHIRPQLLDVFFTKNSTSKRDFSEFGGRNGHSCNAFLPTGQTAMFILAGDDLKNRIKYSYLFSEDHAFSKHRILTIENTNDNEPYLSGFIMLSREIIDLVTSGMVSRPKFGVDFPARRIETALDWDDLVLNSYTMEHILEIKTWIDYGEILLSELGLGKKIKPGYRSLFYGSSGTGKTLTATLLGKATHRDIYCIDLAMVVSKYIGETEKNLEKVFTKAENKNWILFFDEADALFGKRTNISNAHDRFANQEISYLLQRVEDYPGVAILSSNLRSNLDDAFTRRFQSIIYFPMPKQNERHRIWENAFSDQTTLEPDLDLSKIATNYELSGGSIMNVVRYATLMALKKNSTIITLDDIQEGIRKEYNKEGRTV